MLPRNTRGRKQKKKGFGLRFEMKCLECRTGNYKKIAATRTQPKCIVFSAFSAHLVRQMPENYLCAENHKKCVKKNKK